MEKTINIKFLGFGLALTLFFLSCSDVGNESITNQTPASNGQAIHDFFISSPSFTEIRPRKRIPMQSSCYGANLSPTLEWNGAPDDTKSLALLVEDVDHETGVWVHWVLFNIPPTTTGISEGISTTTKILPDGTTQGVNDFKTLGWYGPCIPKKKIDYFGGPRHHTVPHSYYFRLYALDSKIEISPSATKVDLLEAIEGRILSQAETVGKFQVRQEFTPN